MDGFGPRQLLDVVWAMEMERAASGAFTNPYEVRRMLREVYWEGKAPTVKRDPDRLMSADEVSQTKQWEQARVLAEQLRELRGTPASKADQLAAMMGDPMGLPTPEVESSP